ncbi:NAD-dependent epimerase/dehydratase family protein [Candidatus Hakubella thermalkaliphila]|uniref:dTDP-L-rhamnose 4-epimerase n=1 Tax=Candidatus Hakubella thermalkaliphila TaxID=2754717 RepID=A0A6V8P8L2_9ACTN|nr:NAD-dependent epimerase/dehydratase family protein [Candidatus Hakubella thermalkaliphila]MBT9167981.1 dTDP-L-rhamnose 4-epimerase [Bacillota bacterium]GFP28014.1 dTDP-L-rhamnose 4-epimerase [Candidatus Hakubella thermalkaliphila]GFP40931.1 dTDP-L-rhamnose 4-epimerase [Candidatus Hakubella thermalkaliphila]
MKVLVTGGAGMIGSHIVDLLLREGYEVKILDNLELPTHRNGMPDYIPKDAEFIKGDLTRKIDLVRALEGVAVIFHQSATGGFTPQVSKYVIANSLGTARLFEVIRDRNLSIQKIIVASSVAVYGEGTYLCPEHGIFYPTMRSIAQLEKRRWEVECPLCQRVSVPQPVKESKPVSPETVYSITKYDQERLALVLGKLYKIPTVALRYFVTYGPRQSIHNPYTGVCSIFATQIANNKAPLLFEDGLQTRDFVFVEDVARANLLVMKEKKADFKVFNVGSGKAIAIREVAETLINKLNGDVQPLITNEFRPQDVRHIVADITDISQLGYSPSVSFEQGIDRYLEWIERQGKVEDYFSAAKEDLKKAGIIRSPRWL